MNQDKPSIGILPIGEISEIISKSIAAHIGGNLDMRVDLFRPMGDPVYALDGKRFQYNAGVILKSLEEETYEGYGKVIGVLDVDLFIPILSYVFGEARQGGRCALVSTWRLKKNRDGTRASLPLLMERAGKVALHELGHLYNLFHCMDERCLMYFSGGLEDLDSAPLYFCRYCGTYLRDALYLEKGQKRRKRHPPGR